MTTTTTATRVRITDPKREPGDRLLKKIWLLENLIFHKRTPVGEREAAKRMLERVIEIAREKGQDVTSAGGGTAGTWHGYRLPEIRYGAKYEQVKGLSLTEIAKLIREDIKLARKVEAKLGAGTVALVDKLAALATMPKQIKISVRTDYSSVYGSITVRLYNLPEKGWGYVEGKDWSGDKKWVPGPELDAILTALREIHGAYNYDGSDGRVDHHDVGYYGQVEVDWRERP